MVRRRGRGFRRQVSRKFVWDRTRGVIGSSLAGTLPRGVDLLESFRNQPGGTHLGATVSRVRGYIYPEADSAVPAVFFGCSAMRIDSWNEDPVDLANVPFDSPDEDWMAWLPYVQDNSAGPQFAHGNWNPGGGWAVDVKAQRKLEELNQTLWLFTQPPGTGQVNYIYDLSVGLKLA